MATYKPLQSVALTNATSSITLSNIDQSYTDLVLVANIIGTVDSSNIRMTFNGDSSALYSVTWLSGSGSSNTSGRDSGQTSILLSNGTLGSGSNTSPVVFTASIPSYTNTNVYKTVLNRYGTVNATYNGTIAQTSLYRSFNAISSLTLTAQSTTFAAGTTLDLYGIKSGAPQALGGDVVVTDGTYWYHAFKSTSTFTPQKSLTVDALVIGGGGAGGGDVGGGGGAGRVYALTSLSMSAATAYTCTVGAGGAWGANASGGLKGTDSSLIGGALSYTSLGGGGGQGRSYGTAALNDGWSGGGQSYNSDRPATAGNGGYAGGATSGVQSNPCYCGGGGGTTSAGTNSTNGGTSGGAGTSTYSSWATATGTGVGGAYAGGGGGGNYGVSGYRSYGQAGGGYGSYNDAAGAATANTGSGGGGAGSSQYPGLGGSGIVIVRYPV